MKPTSFPSRFFPALLLLLAFTSLGLLSCATPRSAASLPDVSIGLAEFTQPRQTSDLLAGFLPEENPRIDVKILQHLDGLFSDTLRAETKRTIRQLSSSPECRNPELPNKSATGRVAAMHRWVAVGQCLNVDFLLVPQLIDFREREGGEAGVVNPASIVMDVYLIDVRNAALAGRSHYNETQEALSANLLNTRRFIQRGGRWVTASILAQEGMQKAIKDLGL